MRTYSTDEVLEYLQKTNKQRIQEAIDRHDARRWQWSLFVPLVSSSSRTVAFGFLIAVPAGLFVGLTSIPEFFDAMKLSLVVRIIVLLEIVLLATMIGTIAGVILGQLEKYALISQKRAAVFAMGLILGIVLPLCILTLMGYTNWGG